MSAESAQGVLARDAELDAEFNGALRLLVTEGMEDPRSLAGIEKNSGSLCLLSSGASLAISAIASFDRQEV